MHRSPVLFIVAVACGSHSSGSTNPDARTKFRPDATGLGTIAFAASGGGGVPAFTATLVAPARLDLTAQVPTNIPRNADLQLAWTGGTGSQGELALQLFPQDTTTTPAVLVCTFDPAAGAGTVPASLLQSFPATSGRIGIFSMSLEVAAAGPIDVLLLISPVWASGTFTLQ